MTGNHAAVEQLEMTELTAPERAVLRSQLEARCLAVIEEYAADRKWGGATSDEVAIKLDLEISCVAPRITALLHEHERIIASGFRRMTRRGSSASVWIPR